MKGTCDLCHYIDTYNACSSNVYFWVQDLKALKEIKVCEQEKMKFLGYWIFSHFLFQLC